MKIISITSYRQNSQLALVCVRTDDGAEGWGQTSAYLVACR